MTTAAATQPYLESLAKIVSDVVAPQATAIDREGRFPRDAIRALGNAGLLGLVSATEVGGMGLGHRAAAEVVEALGKVCGSTAMVVCMHYCATAVIEAHGSREVREAIAQGRHVTTLAFSETGSRSHFWAPVSSAAPEGDGFRLDGKKSMVTSALEADSYVWSSRPVSGEGVSSIWLVSSKAAGLSSPATFDGLGLRGNASAPITADRVLVSGADRLGADGGGFDVMMGIVLPYFQIINAAFSLGLMEAATAAAAGHAGGAKFEHLGQALAELPTIRAYVARMRIKTDMVRGLLLDTLSALESGREDTMLRVLEIKAAAGEAATEVTDLAMRVCGGAAFRKETGLERIFRDGRAATVMAPTTDVLYDFIGKAACGLPLFG
jgi:alkylation response protein AidB-like acyl-CoA dehydrogenase